MVQPESRCTYDEQMKSHKPFEQAQQRDHGTVVILDQDVFMTELSKRFWPNPAEKLAEIAVEAQQALPPPEPVLAQDDILEYPDKITPEQLASIDAESAVMGPGAVEKAFSATTAQDQVVPAADLFKQRILRAGSTGQEHPVADSFEFDYPQFTEVYQ